MSAATDRSHRAELWPANVSRLRELGIDAQWREAEHDLKVLCPICECGPIIFHEARPFHYCAWPTCSAWMMTFDQVVAALITENAKAKK